MRFLLGVFLLSSACALVGCSDDDAVDSSPSPTIDFPAVAAEAVPGAVLTLEDLEGFEALDVTDLEGRAELSDECNIFEADLVFPEAAATAESEAFTGPLDEQLLDDAAIYRTAEDASADLAATQEILDRCEDEFKDTVEGVARDELERLGLDLGIFANIDVNIASYDPPDAGEEIVGYRMNVEVDLIATRQQYNLDVIVVRDGRLLGALLYGKFGEVNPDAESLLLERATVKLATTDEELPE